MATEAPPTPGQSSAALYTWQSWVHVGPEAENCSDINEESGINECHNPLHFHAWVRLPNPHQWRDIREKGLAAKARTMRMMRDEGSDLNVILEEGVEGLARRGESVHAEIIDELMDVEWWKYVLAAQTDLQFEREDPDDDESPLKWEHIEDDSRRRMKILAMHEDQQPKDELKMLNERLAAYDEALAEARKRHEKPVRDELEKLDISALIDRLRDKRVNQEGSTRFEQTFDEWQMVACTYRQPGGVRLWTDPAELVDVPEPVSEAVKAAFDDLTREKGGLAQGNS